MAKQGRARAPREVERNPMVVSGTDVKGNPFEEVTQTIDISESGVSFYLTTPIWMDSHLTLTIKSSSVFQPDAAMKAKVVRMQNDSSGKRLVGARYD
ncbi:MAG: PilZ domain-containing protein [Terriglobia bacterium]